MAVFTIILFAGFCAISSAVKPEEYTSSYWKELGEKELKIAISKEKINKNVAKNVILFLGDGMSTATITASRILKGQLNGEDGEETILEMDKLSHTGMAKTYSVDRQVSDSASTATAYLCGVKTNYEAMGVNAAATKEDCRSDDPEKNFVDSTLVDAWKEGKSVGVVSTTRITHATPGTTYAHVVQRLWHSDADFEEEDRQFGCKDIAQQFFDSSHMFKVFLGGGRRNFMPNTTFDPEYPEQRNRRLDGQDLIQKWMEKQGSDGRKARYVWNQEEFDQVNPKNTDFLLGIFQPKDMQYETDRESQDGAGEPSIAEMTEKAILMLQTNPEGFVLLVEGGRIDHAHHDGNAYKALHDTIAFDKAIAAGIELTSEHDTLIIVTADHGHTMTVGGYSYRGNPIFGLAPSNEKPKIADDGRTYTTLAYANGPGYEPAYTSDSCNRNNLTGEETALPGFLQPAAVPLGQETHGGEDIAIFSQGPMSHLFYGVHEQSYIATVIRYASCIGPNKAHCEPVATEEQNDEIVFLGKSLSPNDAQTGLYVMFLLLILFLLIFVIFGVFVQKLKNSSKSEPRPEEGQTMMELKV